ncbi:hypothetical protein [Mucilaginibacter paludis]|uniref:Uncharacterized protein n=1 Tax=Mucilaginibacter paludis DSM 18603 TaxID=714943 RepID=H1YHJ3_9SPHI|nr:hypothetical protein [Mucilaginibacter paludis]EHQ26416.1 hypothetical protein Mucpa_2283 [Mucilaginibacter paludis DSM 18603]
MTEITTSSILALSALTPAAMFSYLGLEKYRSKLHFFWSESTVAFDMQFHRGAFERHVRHHIKTQLKEQVTLTIGGEQMKGFIRQNGRNQFTFFINYNSPVISVRKVDGGWQVIDEEEKCPRELAVHFMMTLENRLFS